MHDDLFRSDRRFILVLLAASALSSPTPAAGPPGGESGLVAGKSKVSDGDNLFLRNACQAGLYEVEVARRAEQRAQSPKVKQFARMLVQHHTASNDQLRRLADSKDVQLPNDMPEKRKQKIAALEKQRGAAFDRAFVREVGIADHQADIKLYQDAVRSADDADIKQWANLTLPVLQEHLTTAQGLATDK